MKAQEWVSREKYVGPQTGLKLRLAWRNCFLPRLFLQGLVLSATVALIPGRPSEVRAVTTGHGAWLQQRCAGAVVNPVVTNNGDSGAGSLRQAIMDACDGSTITFGNTVTSPITLTTATLVINKNLTITGPGANLLTVERSSLAGTPLFRIFTITSEVVTISGLTMTNGHTPDGVSGNLGGGGIFNHNGTLTVTNCTISGNQATDGGGIFNDRDDFFHIGSGVLTVTNSTISGNKSSGDGDGGGGIFNGGGVVTVTNSTISGNSAFGNLGGGGIFNSLGAFTVTNSTISDNSAFGNLGGGGIFNDGQIGSGVLTVTNSTISGNKSSGDGGGIFFYAFGIVRLTNSTISGNQAGFGGSGGGICILSPGVIYRARANIIAGNSGYSQWADVFGSFTSEGFNVIGKTEYYSKNGFTQVTDQTGTIASPLDPMLGPLANNGGPTQTHALLAGSPAIDAGDDSVLGSPLFLTTDQRGLGFPRKLGAHVDSGAFEGQISPSDSMKQLIAVVDGFLLPAPGIGVSLDAKLNAALSALAAGDTTMACVDLSDFINEVFAQAGKKLTDTQAYALWASADSIRTALGCP